MSKLNARQQAAVNELLSVTLGGLSERKAVEVLKNFGWDVDRAANFFYESGGAASAPAATARVDAAALLAVFERFKDPDAAPAAIGLEGIGAYCEELGIEPTDIMILYIAFYLGARNMGEFTQAEFVEGWSKLGCDTIEKMKAKFPEFKKKLASKAEFDKFYAWLFKFAKGESKTLKIDMARNLWGLVLQGRFTLLDEWMEFMAAHTLAISLDTWTMVLQFADQTQNGIPDNFDADGEWPTIIDDFVASRGPAGGRG